MEAICEWMHGFSGDPVDETSYAVIRQAVEELAAIAGCPAACFDSAGRCLIRTASFHTASMWQQDFFSEFLLSVRRGESPDLFPKRYRDPAYRFFLLTPLFCREHYWGGVALMEPEPYPQDDACTHWADRTYMLAQAESLLPVYAAVIREYIEMLEDQRDLARELGTSFVLENRIKKQRALVETRLETVLAYRMPAAFLRKGMNAVFASAVLEENTELEEKYDRLAALIRCFRLRTGRMVSVSEEMESFCLYRDTLPYFCNWEPEMRFSVDPGSGDALLPAFSLFRLLGAVCRELFRREAEWRMSVEIRKEEEMISVSIKSRQETDRSEPDRWHLFDILMNFGEISIDNLPENSCRKSMERLRAAFGRKLGTSFQMRDPSEQEFSLRFPYRKAEDTR